MARVPTFSSNRPTLLMRWKCWSLRDWEFKNPISINSVCMLQLLKKYVRLLAQLFFVSSHKERIHWTFCNYSERDQRETLWCSQTMGEWERSNEIVCVQETEWKLSWFGMSLSVSRVSFYVSFLFQTALISIHHKPFIWNSELIHPPLNNPMLHFPSK